MHQQCLIFVAVCPTKYNFKVTVSFYSTVMAKIDVMIPHDSFHKTTLQLVLFLKGLRDNYGFSSSLCLECQLNLTWINIAPASWESQNKHFRYYFSSCFTHTGPLNIKIFNIYVSQSMYIYLYIHVWFYWPDDNLWVNIVAGNGLEIRDALPLSKPMITTSLHMHIIWLYKISISMP